MKSITEITEKNSTYPEKVLQIGEGNFLRAFADYLIDIMNEKGLFGGSVLLCQPIERGMADMINAQNGMYTVMLRGNENGEATERSRIIKSVSRCINPYREYSEFLAAAENPELTLIISNTTEAGIAFDSACLLSDAPPASYPGKLTAFLYHRYTHFDGDKSKGLFILPVELIDNNGTELKRCVNEYIKLWQLPEAFASWVKHDCFFSNTLVDRIVTGYPKEGAEGFFEKLSYSDSLLDTAEPFFFWAVEDDGRIKEAFPADKSGLNVVFTSDISGYKKRKVRILNGSHTLSVLAAYLAGHDTVLEMMNDSRFDKLIRGALKEEIVPFIDLPEDEKADFAASVLERFKNPFIKHRLLDISLNSVSKFRARVLPSLLDYTEDSGAAPRRLSFALASLIAFYDGVWEDGLFYGTRRGERYEIRDDKKVLTFISDALKGDAAAEKILANKELWGLDLNEVPGLCENVNHFLCRIRKGGIDCALEELINE